MIPAESYDELLRNGVVENWSLMNSSGHELTEWYEAVEALARADGLRTRRWGIRSGAGSFDTPVILLARPDGSNYAWIVDLYHWVEDERQNVLGQIKVDWNDVLKGARARAETKRLLLWAISEPAKALTSSELRSRSRRARKEREMLAGWVCAMSDYSYANCFTDEARQDAKAALDAVDRWLDEAQGVTRSV